MTDESHDPFVERISASLRTPERVDPAFEQRVMTDVHAAAFVHAPRFNRRAWLFRQRVVRVTPLAVLAAAAGFALAVVGTAAVVGGRPASRAPAVASADTVHLVRFMYVDPAAQRVSLVGSFNEWQRGAVELRPSGTPGVWVVEMPLRAGRHEYAFVVDGPDGPRWAADPFAVSSRDEFDTETSFLVLSRRPAS